MHDFGSRKLRCLSMLHVKYWRRASTVTLSGCCAGTAYVFMSVWWPVTRRVITDQWLAGEWKTTSPSNWQLLAICWAGACSAASHGWGVHSQRAQGQKWWEQRSGCWKTVQVMVLGAGGWHVPIILGDMRRVQDDVPHMS
jgi:hypothetical protein